MSGASARGRDAVSRHRRVGLASWTFFGEVRPERVPVTWPTPLKGHLKQPDFDVEADFSVMIHASQVIVNLTVTKGEPSVDSLRNIALDCAHTITDLVGYTHGGYFDVEIISAVSRDTDEWRVFGIEIPSLANRKNLHRGPEIESDLFIAATTNVAAGLVLRDLQLAMRDVIGTGFYCYRASEAMMQSMKTAQVKTDKQAWEQLNHVLSLDRSASEWIKQHADFPRHGKPSSITEADRLKILDLTDEIVHRYLEYLRRDLGPLPVKEFPALRV
jgi:hypothetical protein